MYVYIFGSSSLSHYLSTSEIGTYCPGRFTKQCPHTGFPFAILLSYLINITEIFASLPISENKFLIYIFRLQKFKAKFEREIDRDASNCVSETWVEDEF